MTLFGDIDANEIPDDPWHIDDGTYFAILTEVKLIDNEEKGTHGISFNWTIDQEDSPFNGNRIQDWKNRYPNLTAETRTPEIDTDLARLKQRLIQMGVPSEDVGSFLDDQEKYIGTEAYVSVRNWQNQDDPSKKGRNVTFVRIPTYDGE